MVADKKSKDKQATSIKALEERVNEIARAVLGNENFGKVMNSAVTTRTRVQRGFSDRMAKQLHFYNMPSQDDIVQLAEQCGRIEERMVAIESMLHQLLNQKSGTVRKGPARTKKPKSATRSKKPDAK